MRRRFTLVPLSAVLAATLAYSGHASAAPDAVSGVAFRDYNGSGTKDGREIGEPGITVRAYSATAAYGPVTTDAVGAYSIGSIPPGEKVRVEFSGFAGAPGTPKWFLQPSASGGTEAGTSVQFATAGDLNVNVGLVNPAEYAPAGADPAVFVPQFLAYAPTPAAGTSSIFASTYNLGTSATGKAKISDTGAVWGLAPARDGAVFSASYVKSHTAYGSSGSAYTIYRTVGTTTSVFLTLPGTTPVHDTQAVAFTDEGVYDLVAKTGLGDVDMAEDESGLWVTNLETQSLVFIPIVGAASTGTAGSPTSTAVPSPVGCSAPRIMGLGTHDGIVYVGGVCTNEGGSDANLQGYVMAFDTTTSTFTSTPVYTEALTYDRGCANQFAASPTNACAPSTTDYKSAAWRTWANTSTTTDTWTTKFGVVTSVRPQPLLSDIDVDGNHLIVSYRDRNGDQNGYNTSIHPSGSAALMYTIAAGDIRLGCPGSTTGTWIPESASGCTDGSRTATKSLAVPMHNVPEFFSGDFMGDTNGSHEETGLGSATMLPGGDHIVLSVMNPNRGTPIVGNSSGLNALSPDTGAQTGGYQYVQTPATIGGFAKANGLGDIEVLLYTAPVEIGNRVWNDLDSDGIQDPDEPAISGVTVRLLDSADAEVASAVTDSSGHYSFSNGPGTSTGSAKYVVPMTSGTQYRVEVPLAGLNAVPLASLLPTAAIASPAIGDNTALDSDSNGIATPSAAPTASRSSLFVLGAAGHDDHTIDFGFVAKYALGNRVWLDLNNNSILDAGELGLPNAILELLDAAGNSIDPDGSGPLTRTTTTSDSSGYYCFDNLPGGNYRVKATAPIGHISSTVDEIDPNLDVDATPATGASDNGVGVGNMATSGVITLGPSGGTEPTSETDVSASTCTATVNNRTNLTVDFGFRPVVSVGDYTWIDTNANGQQDPGEPVVAGVAVTLYAADGTTVQATTTTNSVGFYSFTGLTPGSTHVIGFSLPSGYGRTGARIGATTSDSNADVTTGKTLVFTAPASGTNSATSPDDPTIDAGYVVLPGTTVATSPPTAAAAVAAPTTTIAPTPTTTTPLPAPTTTTTLAIPTAAPATPAPAVAVAGGVKQPDVGQVAYTGSNALMLALIALVLMGGGVAMLRLTRRRRTA